MFDSPNPPVFSQSLSPARIAYNASTTHLIDLNKILGNHTSIEIEGKRPLTEISPHALAMAANRSKIENMLNFQSEKEPVHGNVGIVEVLLRELVRHACELKIGKRTETRGLYRGTLR